MEDVLYLPRGFVWNRGKDILELEPATDQVFSGARAVSADGMVIAGNSGDFRGPGSSVIWRNPEARNPASLLQALYAGTLDVGPGTSLGDKVLLAQSYYEVPDQVSTCSILQDFIRQVSVLPTKQLDPVVGASLVEDAREVIELIDCH